MTDENLKPARVKQRISSLDQQIQAKKALIQILIDQKRALRQSYIVSMEKMRQNIVQKGSGVDSIRDEYYSEIVRLDNEEQSLTLELDEFLNQRNRLGKALLDDNAGLFFSKKHVFVFFVFFVVCAGLLVSQKHVLFKYVLQQQEVQD